MCEPVTLATIATTTATVAQGYSAYQQGKASQAQGVYENKVAQYNARNMENEATRIRNKGVEEEMRFREQNEQLIARQRVALAARGVDIGEGTPLQLQTDAVTLGEADALRIRSNFADQARVREEEAEFTRIQGESAERAGRAAASAGRSAFGQSLLLAAGGAIAGGVADKWFAGKRAGSTVAGYKGDQFSTWLKRQ